MINNTFARDSTYNAIEVDVSSIDGVLMLAHGAKEHSADMSLQAFISVIRSVARPFLVKFDFKDAHAIIHGLRVLELADLPGTCRHNIVVHANTLVGPGGRHPVIMDTPTFLRMARRALPRARVHIGMRTAWSPATLFFGHTYTRQHIDDLAHYRDVVYCLHMPILSQTPRAVLHRIAGSPLLLWGKAGYLNGLGSTATKTSSLTRT